MGRRCKCKVTGEEGNTDDFYKIERKGRNYYYKSEEVYKQYLRNRSKREKLLGVFAYDICNYKSKAMISKGVLSQIKQLNETYTYEEMIETLKEHMGTFQYYGFMDGKFKNENARQYYLMAILKDKILDTHIRLKNKENIQNKAKDRANLDVEKINEAQNKTNQYIQNKKVDISKFF